MKFLDFVTELPVTAAVVNGGGVSVSVPDPARFAVHKLIVAGERPAAMHTKREKDLWQAAQLFEVLVEERQGDLRLAWDALTERGGGWVRRAEAGLKSLAETQTELAARVSAMIAP
jgi:hypothetical protein